MTTHTVLVTQQDIVRGERDKCKRCPIALAMQREFPDLESSVYATDLWLGKHGFIILPDEAQQFIMYFDEGEPVEPFSFELDLNNKKLGDVALEEAREALRS